MKTIQRALIACSILVSFLVTNGFGQKKIIGYFPDYRLAEVDNIQWNKMTDVIFAFINADANGNLITSSGDAVFGFNSFAFSQVKLKCQQNNVKLQISVGGADNGYQRATRLRDISRNATARANFATQIVNFAITNSLSGIDIDWEFPNESIGGAGGNTTDHKNLIVAIRNAINASSNPSLTLGAAVGGEYTGTIKHTDYVDNTTIPFMDYLYVMAYDLPSSYDANNHSPLAASRNSLDAWALKAGGGSTYNYAKVLLGVPFYGRRASDRYVDDTYMYRNLSASNPAVAYTSDNVGTTYYNGITTINSKIDYLVSKGSPGIFIWDIGQDRYDQYSLLSGIKTKIASTCPITDPNLGPDQGVCQGNITLNSGVATSAGLTFTWILNTTTVVSNSASRNTYTTSVGGTYYVHISNGTCTKSDIINVVTGSSLTIDPVSRCGAGTVTSTVNQTGGTYDWYNLSVGGTKLFTGRSYTTTVSGNTTFYVQQNTGSATYVGGKPSMTTTELNGAQNEAAVSTNNLPRWANRMVVGSDLTINSVMIYRPMVALNGASIVVISAVDGTTIVKTSTGVNIPASGANGTTYTLPVNLQLTPGTYYVGIRIPGANGGGAWPNLAAGVYLLPNTNFTTSVSGIFTISGQAFVNYSLGFNASTTPSINYGQLFNWDISTGVTSPCGRTAAVVTVNAGADVSKTVTTASAICPNSNATVTVVNSELNVLYQAIIGGINVGLPVSGNGNNINLTIPSSNLVGGNNNVTINATRSGCGASTLTTTAVVFVKPFPNVSYGIAGSGTYCQGTNFTLTTSGSQANLIYRAFVGSNPVGATVLGTGSGLILPVVSSNLSVGQNIILVKATDNPCASVDLLNTATVNVTALSNPTLTIGGATKVYGDVPFTISSGSNSSGSITYGILAPNTVASINPSSGQVTITNAGTVSLVATQAAAGCFNAATSTGTLTVNKKSLSVTANNQTKTFNTANPTLTVSYNGFVGSENASVLNVLPTVTTSAVTNSPVGTYPIGVSGGFDNNYTFTYTFGTLTVTRAIPSLSITSTNTGQAGSTISLTASTNSTGAVTWSVVSGNGSISGSTLTLLASGSVTIQANVAQDANYSASSVQQTITITAQTAPTIGFGNVNKVYGDAPFAMTATSNSSGARTYSITSGTAFAQISASTGTVTILGAGTVTVRVDQSASGTFASGSATATLTIGKKSLNVQPTSTSRPYNASNPAFAVGYTGFVGTDNASVLDTPPTLGTNAVVSSPAGLYTITATGGLDNNYSFTYLTGTLTITKIAPSLNITSANVGQQGTNISLTASSNSTGAVTWSVISGNGSITGSTLSLGAVGTVTIQASLATDVNYLSATALQTITITSQTVPTLTFADVNKTYGDAPFTVAATSNSPGAFTYSIVSGNALASVSPAGTVTILGAGSITLRVDQAASGSFSATSKSATLTVTKKGLTVTALNQTRAYNTANPSFTVTIAGFVLGETASVLDVVPTASSSATQSSNAGSYTIVPAGGSDNNYSFTYINGTLVITKVNPTLNITSANSGQAGSTINLTANSNSSGALTWSVLAGNGNISGNTLSLTSAGTVTVQAAIAADVNFNASTARQVITISAQTVPTITFNNITKTFGDPDFTVAVSSNSPGAFTYSISSGNAFATINASSGLVSIVGAGNVTLVAVQAASGTFAAATATSTLTINKANRTVSITSGNAVQAGNSLSLTGNTNPAGGVISWSIQSQSGTTASISGSTLAAGANAGSLVVVANAAADANYNAASTTQTINVSTLSIPTITYNDIVKTFGDAPFTFSATSNSAGAITYSIVSGNSLAAINSLNGQVTILGAGSVVVQASQAADGSFAATTKSATITINKANRPSFSITSSATGVAGSSIALTSNSTSTVVWSVTNGTGNASVNGNTLNLITAGTVTLTGTVLGDNNFNSISVSQEVVISTVTELKEAVVGGLKFEFAPNPANESTVLILQLPEVSPVDINVFDARGVLVLSIAKGSTLDNGSHAIDLGSLPTGTYIATLVFKNQVQHVRLVKQ